MLGDIPQLSSAMTGAVIFLRHGELIVRRFARNVASQAFYPRGRAVVKSNHNRQAVPCDSRRYHAG